MNSDAASERRFYDERTERPWLGRFAVGRVAAISRPSPARGGPNQDAAAIFPVGEALIAAVADGLGGGPDGDVASRVALDSLGEALREAGPEDESLRGAVMNGIERANAAVSRLGSGAMTTLAVIEVRPGSLRCYHVGDSVVMLFGPGGKVRYETVSHSPVGYGVESGMLDPGEAIWHEQRHLVFNVVGSPEMRIEVGPTLPLGRRDTVLVASDGLTDNLHRGELASIASRGRLSAAAATLADLATTRMAAGDAEQPSKPDDLTLLLFRP